MELCITNCTYKFINLSYLKHRFCPKRMSLTLPKDYNETTTKLWHKQLTLPRSICTTAPEYCDIHTYMGTHVIQVFWLTLQCTYNICIRRVYSINNNCDNINSASIVPWEYSKVVQYQNSSNQQSQQMQPTYAVK